MTIQEKISSWVDSRRADYLRDVSRLVAIRSVSGEEKAGMPFGEGPAAALAEALKIAADYTALTIAETVKNPENPWYGVDFEKTIPVLVDELKRIGEA